MKHRLALLLALALPGVAQATPPAPAVADQRLWMGASWYPEQWPEERWDADLTLMEKAGANVVRVGEFGWSRMEPSEGHYDLDWLERAVRAAERHHIKVVIGTPTDTPPNWMTTKYPQVMKIASDGTPAGLGGRRQFSISSPLYRDFCRQIVAELARRFGRDPNVIGWQIGNEFTDESYDPAAKAAWHTWLREKYGTLDALNAAWTTAYWSQTYFAWDQVPFTDKPGNPGWMMDEKRFVTDQWVAFEKNQLDALHPAIAARQFVTTNLGGLGWADRFDRYAINLDLDLASWDDYVGTGHLKPDRNGATHDLARGWKRRNFWVMEAQPGYVNWSPDNNILTRGETRAMAWQAIGHGADAVLYWQWRSALNGQEQYHGAVVGPDGTPLPFYDEFAEIGRDFAKASPALAGTAPVSDVAILQDYPSRWAIDFQPHTKDYDQIEVLLDTYRPLKEELGAVDIVEASGPLDRYKLLFAPSLNVIPQALADHLAAYVKAGGHLVLGPRAGMKDAENSLNVQRQPGPLVDVLGGRVEQYYALDERDRVQVSGAAGSGTATIWGEMLSTRAPDTQVTLRYGKANGWLDGQPAAITRAYGKGRITYLGALLDPALMKAFVDSQMADAKVAPGLAVPQGVEAMTREGDGKRITILINDGASPQHVALPTRMSDVLAGGDTTDVQLAPEGVAILEQPEGETMMRGTTILALALLAGAAGTARAEDYPMAFKAPAVAKQLAHVDAETRNGPFQPDWNSLENFRVPEWFRDAKFGIFIHWGVYSVPAFLTEWDSRNMYDPHNVAYTYHRKVYGPQSKFGYKDFIPQFKAEKFDARQWIALFQQAGARYVIPVAEHCDGFAMYDSDMTDWKVTAMGPKRDTAGELMAAARAAGMHFGLSSHRAEHWWWYNVGRGYDSDVDDPRYAGLYGPAAPRTLPGDPSGTEPSPDHLENWMPPNKEFKDDWLARTTELVDKYKPEMIYLDWWTAAPGFEPYLRRLAAFYYDEGKKNGQGVALTYKGENFADGAALFDVERGKLDTLRLVPWQTDTSVSIHSWGYAQDDEYRTPKSLIDDLIDIVSKNGNLLLNVGPKADGTIPEQDQKVLLGIGAWLKVNGEAIYGTRPWQYFGEGPTTVVSGEKKESPNKTWTTADIRFTTKGDALYAMGLERPKDGAVLIKTLYAGTPYLDRPIASIALLGDARPLSWQQTPTGLRVTLPADPGGTMPYALKIAFTGTSQVASR